MEVISSQLHQNTGTELTVPSGYISRLEWQQLLLDATAPELELLVTDHRDEDISDDDSELPADYPPLSIAARILTMLYERFAHDEEEARQLTIINKNLTREELLQLESIVLELAHVNDVKPQFIDWMESHVHFSSSFSAEGAGTI
jgi:tagaturonate reductase